MDYKNKLIQGSAPEVLKELPDGSVHCCFTSSPYWSLRSYPGADTIWDSNNGCLHEWGELLSNPKKENRTNEELIINGIHGLSGSTSDTLPKDSGQYCQKCGAWSGQLGLEPHYSDFVRHLADIFDEFKRVLSDFGSLWVNLGDTYSTHTSKRSGQFGTELTDERNSIFAEKRLKQITGEKSLALIPFRFAIEMTQRGWIHRQTIIWKKNNCMPSSALDRFTVDFEYIFLFTKGTKTQYYTNEKTLQCARKKPAGLKGIQDIDWELVECQHCSGTGKQKEKPCKRCNGKGEVTRSLWSSHDYFFNQQFEEIKESSIERNKYDWNSKQRTRDPREKRGIDNRKAGFLFNSLGRNARTTWEMSFEDYMAWCAELYHINKEMSSTWEINTEPFSAAHFACFPRALAKRPIDAGCPEFICRKCGLPRVKIYRFTGDYDTQGGLGSKTADHLETSVSSSLRTKKVRVKEFVEYSDCGCNAGFEPGVTCDPFAGSGTTLQVAKEMSRHYVGIEINPEYIDIANKFRLGQGAFNFNLETKDEVYE